jgi:serine/threonine-protein kinase
MGLVYRARDPLLHREVALKVITGTDVSEEMLERFRIEARAAASLDHPNIVVVYDLGEEGGQPYIAMELLKGRDLRQHVRAQGGVSVRDAAELISQVCDGLSYAHERRIVHRDIKPANVHICPDGRVKIVDFGVAKMESTALTKTGMVIGTPDYMSPEQIQGKGVDARSDIFSTGVVLYELLTGNKPFSAESITSVVYNIVFKEPKRFDELDLDVPPDLERIVARAMAKDLSARYQAIGEMRDDLRAFLMGAAVSRPGEKDQRTNGGDATAVLTPEEMSQALPAAPATGQSRTVQVGESPEQRQAAAGVEAKAPPERSRTPLLAAIAAVVVLAAVGVGWKLLSGGPEEPPAGRAPAGVVAGPPVPIDVVVAPWARIERFERRDADGAWRPVPLTENLTPLRLSVPAGRYRMRLSHPDVATQEEVEFTVAEEGGRPVRHVLAGFDPTLASAGWLGGR